MEGYSVCCKKFDVVVRKKLDGVLMLIDSIPPNFSINPGTNRCTPFDCNITRYMTRAIILPMAKETPLVPKRSVIHAGS